MQKKILFVVTKSNWGGAQRYVFDLATRLLSEKFDVAVAFGPGPDGKIGRLAKLLAEQSVHTIFVRDLARDVSLRSDWRAFSALIGIFRAEQPDIVHVNSSKAGGLGVFAARLSGIRRIIFTLHGLPADEARSPLARAIILILTWLTIVLSHHTIVLSNDALVRLRRLPFTHRKLVLIYSGIEAPPFETHADALKALRSIDPKIPETSVGMIGELHPNKDMRTAIAAVALTDRHLVIIGDGEEKVALQTFARERGCAHRIHFLGHIPEAARYLRAFDIFLLTSIKEGLPYVLLEAGSAGVPVVATDIAGVRDIILPDFTGLLAPPKDAQKIAAALGRIADASLARSLTDELSTRILKTFSLPRMLEKTRALYE